MIFFTIFKIDGWHFLNEFSKFDVKYLELRGRIIKMKVYKKLGLLVLFVLWRMRFLNIRQVMCKISSRWDLKSPDFSKLHFVGKRGKKLNIKKIVPSELLKWST